VIAAGLGLHLGIDYSLRVGVFGLAIAVSYLAFAPPPFSARVLGGLRTRGAHLSRRLARLTAEPPSVLRRR
jgi:hypothetical protein